jgi:SpoVK/Ycf46/Vps4 family AAA+-type ATPase
MGAGKTSLGLGVLHEFKQINPNFSTFFADYTLLINNPDESLKKLFSSAMQNEPSVVFIDGLDNLCSK